MKIKRLSLKNFRQFEDIDIKFSTTTGKNVNVILAENSTGKTTLMQSIKWCLYGDAETDLDNLNELANYGVINNSLNDREEVWVELVIKESNVMYNIRRTKEFFVASQRKASEDIKLEYKTDDGETIILRGDPDSYEPEVKKIKRMINAILSKEMANYFLFDGERIDNLGKNNSQSRNDVKQAINAINNFNIIENAIDSLNSINRQYRRNISTQSNDSSLQSLVKTINEVEKEILENTNNIQSSRKKVSLMKEEVELLDEELVSYDEIEVLVTERKALERSLAKDNKRLEELRKKLLTQHSNYHHKSLITLLNEKYKNIEFNKEHEEITIPGMKVSAIDHVIERGTCICGEPLTDNHMNHLINQREAQPPISNTDLINDFKHTINLATVGLENNIDDFYRYRNEFIELSDNVTHSSDDIEDLSEKIGNSNTEEIKQKNDKRLELKEEIKHSETSIEINNDRISKLKSELINLESDYSNKLKENKEHKFNIIKLDLIEKSLTALINRNEAFRKEKKEEIEKIANKHFSDIIYKNKMIRINDNFEYQVIEENGKTASPSEGERMAISMSLVLAIIEVHKNTQSNQNSQYDFDLDGTDFCLVLDAAFAKLDEQFSRRISQKLPESVEQIILFSTVKQYQGAVEDSLKNHIGKKYSLTIPNDERENALTNNDLVLLKG